MSRLAHRPTLPQQLAWHLSLLGYWTLDVCRFAGGLLHRHRLAELRVASVAALAVVLCQPAATFTIRLAAAPAVEAAVNSESAAAPVERAGLFSAPAPAPSAAVDAHALMLIERFDHVAAAEADRFGLDAGVLLAAAIAASSQADATNVFGEALQGSFPTAWTSWRAMSLSLLAAADAPATRAAWVDAAASLYPDRERARTSIAYALDRYAL